MCTAKQGINETPIIACDESGNTGQDLLNASQPVFTVASVSLTDDDARVLLARVTPKGAKEAKFSQLQRSATGREGVIALLASPLIHPKNAKLHVIDKSYMVTTKIVDLLVEPLAHADGIDLLKQGANIALANMHHIGMPAFCGPALTAALQQAFVQMIRRKDQASITDFYTCATRLHRGCSDAKYRTLLAPVLASRTMVDELLGGKGRLALEPALSAFICLCDAWGRQLSREFNIVHDRSVPIEQQRQLIAFVSARDEREVEVGYDRRKICLPLKIGTVTFEDSRAVPQLQVADVLAGAFAYRAQAMAGSSSDPTFEARLDEAGIHDLVTGAIWPSDAVTPEELGTASVGGIDAVDYIAKMLKRQGEKSL